MKAFIGLVNKDMLLARFGYIVWLVGGTLLLLGAYVLALRTDKELIVTPFIFMVLILHVPFGPLMMLSLLRIEGRTQLWLYNPQGSVKLLLAKMTATALFLVLSQLLFNAQTFIFVKWLKAKGISNEIVTLFAPEDLLLINSIFFAVAMYLATWIIFLWVIYHSLGKFPALRSWRWLAVILILIAINSIEAMAYRIESVSNFFSKYVLKFSIATEFHYDKIAGWTVVQNDLGIPILPLIAYVVLALTLFYIACVLLDKKVEV